MFSMYVSHVVSKYIKKATDNQRSINNYTFRSKELREKNQREDCMYVSKTVNCNTQTQIRRYAEKRREEKKKKE